MNSNDEKVKPNLLIQAAQKKAALQACGKKTGILGKDLSKQYNSNSSHFFRPTKPGGRNGNGKPS